MNTTAVEAAAARGIRVEALPQPDNWGNRWEATIPRKGRGTQQQPLASMLAATAEEAACAALQYVGARGWQ